MNFRKLLTYLTVGTAAVIPFAGAQNPTILQGSYISNVFGNSNFVLNPNAQTNVANVTNATRSISTPLVATSEFTVNLTSSTFATWTLRAFDGGMKGQNCEARFTYRGFATATTKAEIVQNSLVVASLTLIPTTDPRIASINFPCGDLANLTTFRIAQTTANMTTVTPNEIGGIYVGLATNMANVAQAEATLNVFRSTLLSVPTSTDTTVLWNDIGLDALGEYTAGTGIYKAKRAGQYLISAQILYDNAAWVAGNQNDLYILKNNALTSSNVNYLQATVTTYITAQVTATVALAVGDEIKVVVRQGSAAAKNLLANGVYNHFKIYRFPSSSELVVTPERQGNWYVNAYHDGANIALSTATVSSKTEMTNASLTLKPVANSQPVATLCASGNNPPAVSTGNTICSAGNESLGITFNIPSVGGYEVCATFSQNTKVPQNGYTDATFSIEETSTSSSTNLTDNPTVATFTQISSVSDLSISNPVKACSNFNFTSLGQKAVRLLYRQNVLGTVTTNQILADATLGRGVIWSVIPLSTQSNSALYVQGPVKAAISNTAIPTDSIGGKVIDSSLARTTTALGTWQVASGNFGTPPAGSYLMIMNSVGTAAAGLAGTGSIINENGSSVVPVVCQLNSINSTANDSVYGRVCYYTTDGTKTLYAWAQAVGANTTVTTNLILVRLN